MSALIIGTFNNQSVIAFPTAPGLASIELSFSDAVAVNTSPYTGQSQFYTWPGAEMISGTLHWPTMKRANAAAVTAFLAECRGISSCFLLCIDPNALPAGTPSGTPVCGNTLALATSINTRGWEPNTTVMAAGDYFQVNAVPTSTGVWSVAPRVYMTTTDVLSDTDGNATITVWPSVRESIQDGAAIITDRPQGLFRLAENTRSIQLAPLTYGVSLKIVEAR